MKRLKLRIGLLNVQSGIGITRGYYQYLCYLHKYLFPHGSQNIRRLGELALSENIDILATTEIDQGSLRTRNTDQVALLARSGEFGYDIFFPTLRLGERVNQGNAIHSRFPILGSRMYFLPGQGEPRSAGRARIRVDHETDIDFFVTHLSLSLAYRESQIQELSSYVNDSPNPVILAGDFNVWSEGELELLEKSKLKMAYTAKTYPSWKPRRRLDYIFASPELSIREGKTHGTLLSDHLLLIVDVAINRP
jgi:endonuclease/exonuclease/phosphatase family metal-dependent hydrolase